MAEEQRKLSFLQVLGSVMSSFLGVQKNATRERDFKRGRARDFILVGVLLIGVVLVRTVVADIAQAITFRVC